MSKPDAYIIHNFTQKQAVQLQISMCHTNRDYFILKLFKLIFFSTSPQPQIVFIVKVIVFSLTHSL